MKTGCDRRLEKSFCDAPVIPVSPHSRIVMFSDCHRGVGNANDNFLKNQHLYFAALRHYYDACFTYIELGDGDELWENRSLSAIQEIHSDVFWLFSLFAQKKRLYLIYGNHDHVMKDCPEFPHYAGVILKPVRPRHSNAAAEPPEIYLTHGHQADLLNSVFWKLSRFLVRHLWRPLEQRGVLDPTSAAKNYKRRKRTEQKLSQWAQKNDCYLITGHTHRPMLDGGETRYFNAGSCVHPRCITCLELENGSLSLVKWCVETRQDRSLFVARAVLAGPLPLLDTDV